MKGSSTFRHDGFKGDVRKLKKNTSFKKGVVTITELEHSHQFHSHDSRGRKQQYCTPMGGHFHEVKIIYDENGVPVRAECGPPLRFQNKKTPLGSKKRIVDVKWHDQVNEKIVVDDHRHVFEYTHSEELNAKRVQQIRNATQSAIGAMTGGAAPKMHDDGPGAADVGLEDGGDDE